MRIPREEKEEGRGDGRECILLQKTNSVRILPSLPGDGFRSYCVFSSCHIYLGVINFLLSPIFKKTIMAPPACYHCILFVGGGSQAGRGVTLNDALVQQCLPGTKGAGSWCSESDTSEPKPVPGQSCSRVFLLLNFGLLDGALGQTGLWYISQSCASYV